MAVIHQNSDLSLADKINQIEENASRRSRKPLVLFIILLFVFLLLHAYPGGIVELGSNICDKMQSSSSILQLLLSVPVMMGIWLCGFLFLPLGMINIFCEMVKDQKTVSEKKAVEILQAGLEGEAKALQVLSALPDDYHLFTNTILEYEGMKSETDLIVVGPTGIFIIEVKNYKGKLYGSCESKTLTHVKTGGMEEEVYNPLKQVSTHVYRLANLLREKGIRCWVEGFVYFTDNDLNLSLEEDGHYEMNASPRKYYHNGKNLLQAIKGNSTVLPLHTVSDIVEYLEQN